MTRIRKYFKVKIPTMKVNLFNEDNYIQMGGLGHSRSRKYSRRLNRWKDNLMEYSIPCCSCCFTLNGVFRRRKLNIFGYVYNKSLRSNLLDEEENIGSSDVSLLPPSANEMGSLKNNVTDNQSDCVIEDPNQPDYVIVEDGNNQCDCPVSNSSQSEETNEPLFKYSTQSISPEIVVIPTDTPELIKRFPRRRSSSPCLGKMSNLRVRYGSRSSNDDVNSSQSDCSTETISQSDLSTYLVIESQEEKKTRRSSSPCFGRRNEFMVYREQRLSFFSSEATSRGRSYSQRYDLCSSPRLAEVCSPRARSKTFDTINEHPKRDSNSPVARRRRISVKSTAVRKHSSRSTTPRQRRKTVSTYTPAFNQYNGSDGHLSSAVTPSRRLSVAVGRKTSTTFQRKQRRCSEPFLLDSLSLQGLGGAGNNKWNRKQSTSNGRVKRRLSTAGVLPASSKQKLQALAKDELLASLNVPLSNAPEITVDDEEVLDELVDSENEAIEESDEKKAQIEKERRETKRLLIIEEILETEKNYISCLGTLDLVFRSHLKDANIITEKDLNSLFPSHLQDIKQAHALFMEDLEERMNNDDWRGIIGDIFAKMTSASVNLLEMYTMYVNSFPKAISTLSKCTRSSGKFRKFLEDCYENPVVERLDLPSFLLSPVQRLPRYILLLRELLKYTDEDHPDCYFISQAMKEMESLISSLNSSIHQSMEFYSASETRRKKMSRQFTSKKRKQRASSTILRNNKNMKPVSENKSDNDQGYCSFGERKDESPEDESGRKPRSSSTLKNHPGKRSMSVISNASDDSTKQVIRRKNDLQLTGRNTDTRKSWRRSIGAVFSHLWSNKDGEETSSQMDTSDNLDITSLNENRGSQDHIDGIPSNSTPYNRKNSSVKRKHAIALPSPMIEEVDSSSDSPRLAMENSVLDGNENIQQINTLVENTTLNDTEISTSPVGEMDIPLCVVSDDDCDRKNSTESERSNTASPSSLKTPPSPQNFRRNGRLRGSAGPVFKSIFQKNSTKMQKTVSMDALNTNKYSEQDDKKKQRALKKRNKELHKSATVIAQRTTVESGYPIVKSLSSCNISHEDSQSVSSSETISSKTSGSVKEEQDGGENYVITENNNKFVKSKTERKSKIFKTLKSFVGKK
ncbi:rhoGEF domain-containing protein gxcJ-like isoform X3 [Clytia hemisphaerica]|uniref:rhoGEF domain-containing protein gxcJ-like isoform X3 n=1 Tax=Clytia hemisphaerica TaxID=252671 RepID=UPI0034D73006